MAGVSYHRLFIEYSKRNNFNVVFRNALENVAGKVDFSQVKSCVAFGTGSGEREMEFARRLLPNLRSLTAVEPDPEAAKALRASFQDGQLPGVETSVVETSIESWSGVDNHVDAVLLFNVLCHVHLADRKALFQKLTTRYLSHDGVVVIADSITSVPNGYVDLLKRLGMPRVGYHELEEGMVATGFRVVYKQDFEVRRDLSNPSDDVVKYIQLMAEYKFTESQVRTTIDDVYSRPNMRISPNMMGIFTK